jgi:hypothetical protein
MPHRPRATNSPAESELRAVQWAGPGGPNCRWSTRLAGSPQKPMNALALAKRRQSPTSPGQGERAQPGHAPVGCQPNGGRAHQPARSASTASSWALRTSTTAGSWPNVCAIAGWSNRWDRSPGLVGVGPGGAAPPGPGRGAAGTCPAALRARVRSATMSARVRHRSRTASSWAVGIRTQVSSPARCSRGEPAAVPPVGLGPCRRVPAGSATGRPPRSARAGCATAGPAQSRSARPRSRLAAGGDHPGGRRACGPTARRWRSARRRGPAGQGSRSRPRWCPCGRPGRGGSGRGASQHGTAGSLRMVAPPAQCG